MPTLSHKNQQENIPVAQQGFGAEATLAWLRNHPEIPALAESYETVIALAKDVAAQGGQTFLVGGAVRDEILGAVPQDFDLEVHGLATESLEKILHTYGVTQPTGKSFGTYKLPASTSTVKIEVALPRRDSQFGVKHTDVNVDIQPHLGLIEAARRREFTISAIYKDVLSGAIYDPFNGLGDLASKTLRLVDEKTFGDDALRVLRGAAHAARFNLTVEDQTKKVMAEMVEKMGALPKDRLREEWSNMFVRGKRPSLGLMLLQEIGVLDRWHPEVAMLWSIPQSPVHHPEGDVGTHTMMVIDSAADLGHQENFTLSELKELLFAALLHDIGKSVTTKEIDGQLHAYGHEAAGTKPAETFLKNIGLPPTSINNVVRLILNHLRPPHLYRHRAEISGSALKKLARDIGPAHVLTLISLAEADHRGRGPFPTNRGTAEFPNTTKYHAWWREQSERLKLSQPPEQILWGRDLVEGGRAWPAGPGVGEAVRLAELLSVEGMTREEILRIIDDSGSSASALTELRKLLPT